MTIRGGLVYPVSVEDRFSTATRRFREEIAASRAVFRAFRRSLQTPFTANNVLQQTTRAARDLSNATRDLNRVRSSSQATTRETETSEARLARIQALQSSRLREIADAAQAASQVAAQNNSRTQEESRIREQIVDRILRQAEALARLRILSENDRLVNGLSTEQEAWAQNERAIQGNRVELERLRQLQAQGDRNLRGEAPADTVERTRLRLLRQLAEAEEAAKVAADERFAVDRQGRLILNPLIQAEREYTDLLQRRAAEERRLELLANDNRGADGLNAQQRALRAYNRELQNLATQEERLALARDRSDDDFVERTAQVRAETQATRDLINIKSRLLAQEVAENVTDNEGSNLNELRARETAERRIRAEKQRQAEAQAEINARQAQGLRVTRDLRRAAAGTREEFDRFNGSVNRSIFSLRRLFLIFGAFEAVRGAFRGFSETVQSGIRFNATLEQAELSIAALIAAAGDLPDLFGGSADAATRLQLSLNEARRQNALLRQDALRTTATYEELVQNFQLAVAPGISQGGSLDQIREFTVQVTQAAAALGIANNQLSEEIRNLVQGTVNIRTTRIAAALGITNEDIRRAQEAGTLFQFFQREFAAFDEAGRRAQETFAGLTARIRDTFSLATGQASTGLFEELRGGLEDIIDLLSSPDIDTGQLLPDEQAVDVFGEIFSALEDVVAQAREFAASLDFEEVLAAARTIGNLIRGVGAALIGVTRGILQVFETLQPLADQLLDTFSTDQIEEFTSGLVQIVVQFGIISGAARALSVGFGAVLRPFRAVRTLVGELRQSIGRLATSGGRLGAAFAGLQGSLLAIRAALAGLAAPVAAFAATVTAAVLGINELGDRIAGVNLGLSESFRVVTLQLGILGERFGQFVGGVLDFFLGIIPGVSDNLEASLARSQERIAQLRQEIEGIAAAASVLEGASPSVDASPATVDPDPIVRVGTAFESLGLSVISVQSRIQELTKDFEELNKESERSARELSFEVNTTGLDIQRIQFERSLALSESLENSVRDRELAQTRLNRALRESATVNAEIRNLDETRAGQFENIIRFVQREADIQERQKAVREEIRDIELQRDGARTSEERDTLNLRLDELRVAQQTLEAEEQFRRAGLAGQSIRQSALNLAERQIGLDREIAAQRDTIAQLTQSEERTREASLRLAVREVALLSARNNRSRVQELETLRLQVNSTRDLLQDTREITSQRALERRELEQNLELQRLASEQELEALQDRRESLIETLRVREQAPSITREELAPIEEEIQLLSALIRSRRQLNALEAAQQRAVVERDDRDRIEALRGENLLTDRQNSLLRAQARAEQSIAEAIARRANQQELATVRADAELNVSIERVEVERDQLDLAEQVAEQRLQETREIGIQEEISLAEDSLRLVREGNQAERERLDALLRRLQALRDISSQEQEIAQIRQQFDADQRLTGVALETGELSQQLQFQRENLRLEQARASETVRAVSAARQRTQEAQLALNLAQRDNDLTLESLDFERRAALQDGNNLKAQQLETEFGLLQEQFRVQESLLAVQVRINQELQRQAELRAGPNFFAGLAQGAVDFANSLPTLFEAGAEAARTALEGLSQTLSQSLLVALSGQEDAEEIIGDLFEQLGVRLAQSLTNLLIESLIQTLLAQAGLASLQVSTGALQASILLQQGGELAATAMIAGATQAAAILGGTSLGAGAPGLGRISGGQIPNYAFGSSGHYGPGAAGYVSGGRIAGARTSQRFASTYKPVRPKNLDRRDTTPIWAQPGEFMQPLSSVKMYGLKFMEMIRQGAIPPEDLPFAKSSGVRTPRNSKPGYVDGGLIGGGGRSTSTRSSSGGGSEVTALPVLVADDASVRRLLAGGKPSMLRFLAENGFRRG